MPNSLIHFVPKSVLLICILMLAACANTPQVTSELPDPELEAINLSIKSLRSSLTEQYTEICEAQQRKLKASNNSITKKLKEGKRRYTKLEQRCEAKSMAGKLLVGAVENVRLLDEELTFSARVDTGAETSSIGVFRLQDFERDGKTWVKFKLADKKAAPTYEYRVNGRVSIKQNASTDGDQRFEIKMNIRIGDRDYPRQVFNLADRSYLDHQVLIGRSFLTDVAIVDTGSKYRLRK